MSEKLNTTYVEVSDFDATDFLNEENEQIAERRRAMLGEQALKNLAQGERLFGVVTTHDAEGNKVVDRVVNLGDDFGTEVIHEPHPEMGEVKHSHFKEEVPQQSWSEAPARPQYDFTPPSHQQPRSNNPDLVARQQELGIEVDEPGQMPVRQSVVQNNAPRGVSRGSRNEHISDDEWFEGGHYLR